MTIEARKIEFVQEFLKLQSEDVISLLEKILRKEKQTSTEETLEPFTLEELNIRIEQSESDFSNKKYKTTSELLEKYK